MHGVWEREACIIPRPLLFDAAEEADVGQTDYIAKESK